MNISNNGIAILKRLEESVKQNGRHIIYDDQTGAPIATNSPLPRGATIGYGHLIKQGEDFTTGITESAAAELLRTDIATAERAVQSAITRPITQNQFDALVILAYNIGAKNFTDSTVVKYINNPTFHSATYPTLESAWHAWNKSNGREIAGLTARRDTEWKLFCAI